YHHNVTEGRGIDGGGPETPGLSAMQIVVWRYAPPQSEAAEWEDSDEKEPVWRHPCRDRLGHARIERPRRTGDRIRASGRAGMLRALARRDCILQISRQGRALPDSAGKRLYRQHMAHPDGADGKGLRRSAGSRRKTEGVQGRFHR